MTLAAVTAAYSKAFTSENPWTITHGLQTLTPIIDIYDGSDERIMPAAVVVLDENTIRVDWSGNTTGRVYVV